MLIWDANEKVTEHLREQGHLLHAERFMHSYPHDWRSKTPVIFRATEQWFIGVDEPTKRDEKSLRQLALDSIDGIQFFPEWGRNRFRGMLESRPDWCLSPPTGLGPAYSRLPRCQRRGSDDRCFGASGVWPSSAKKVPTLGLPALQTNCWPAGTRRVIRKHPLILTYPPSRRPMTSLTCGWNPVPPERRHAGPRHWLPHRSVLEGSDQHRGWFQLSLLPALRQRRAPVQSHPDPWLHGRQRRSQDEQAARNALDVDELLQQYGADVCRWWVASLPFENDISDLLLL